MLDSDNHHYVPQWYQRQFLPEQGGEFFVLDKSPAQSVVCDDGIIRKIKKPRNIYTWGTKKLFQQPGLYSVALRGVREDSIERLLFGQIDRRGAKASGLFRAWPPSTGFGPAEDDIPQHYGHPSHRMMDLLMFMNAQKARTPKGLAQIKYDLARQGHIGASNAVVMAFFLQRRQLNCTVWAEGMWEIFSAKSATIKLLLSDDPVILYNCDCFPESEPCRYPHDPNAFWRGTRVIYPLSPNSVLVISHVEHADDPSRTKARRDRKNARSHDETIISYTNIINDRDLNDQQVATINYLIKMRAVKYVASICKDHLFPETIIDQPRWCDIDKIFYTEFPSFRSQTEIMVGYKDGSQLHANAFGERTVVPGWFVRQQEKKKQAEEAAKKSVKNT